MIHTIFASVRDRLRDNLEFAGEAQPSHSMGAGTTELASPPDIIWELMGGLVSAAKQTSSGGRREVREIAMRHERVLVHVWGGGFEKTEKLANHFVAAAREACTSGFAFRPISTRWAGQDKHTGKGVALLVEVEFDVPFTAEPLAVVKPTHLPTIVGEIEHEIPLNQA